MKDTDIKFSNNMKATFLFLSTLSKLNSLEEVNNFLQPCYFHKGHYSESVNKIVYENAKTIMKALQEKPIDTDKLQTACRNISNTNREFDYKGQLLVSTPYALMKCVAYAIKNLIDAGARTKKDILVTGYPNKLDLALADLGIFKEEEIKPVFNPNGTTAAMLNKLVNDKWLGKPKSEPDKDRHNEITEYVVELINNCLKKENLYSGTCYGDARCESLGSHVFGQIQTKNPPEYFAHPFIYISLAALKGVYTSINAHFEADLNIDSLRHFYSNGDTITKDNITLEALCVMHASTDK